MNILKRIISGIFQFVNRRTVSQFTRVHNIVHGTTSPIFDICSVKSWVWTHPFIHLDIYNEGQHKVYTFRVYLPVDHQVLIRYDQCSVKIKIQDEIQYDYSLDISILGKFFEKKKQKVVQNRSFRVYQKFYFGFLETEKNVCLLISKLLQYTNKYSQNIKHKT